ncbi:PDZ and LIM domain protein 3-like [Glandiceps talaboti]
MQFEVTLQGPSPWGFRLGGGKGTGGPLIIAKTTAGGKAGQAQILPNDVILKINDERAETLTMSDAQNLIKDATEIVFLIQRLDSGVQKTPRQAAEPVFDPNAPMPGSAKVVHLQYNSPVGIYSAQNIAEAFKGQTAGLATTGVLGGQGGRPIDTQSAVFQAVHQANPNYQHGEASEQYIDRAQGEEMRYHAYMNPGRQSRSFKMLEEMVQYE